MIANQDTMVHTFWDCNKKFFNSSLPTPIFDTINNINIIAKFEYYKSKKNAKKPIRNQIIKISDCFDFSEKDFIDTMAHEMVHYYIAWNKIKDNKSHGKRFMEIANSLNKHYGLNIEKTKDASSYKLTEKAPKIIKKKKSILKFLFGLN